MHIYLYIATYSIEVKLPNLPGNYDRPTDRRAHSGDSQDKTTDLWYTVYIGIQ